MKIVFEHLINYIEENPSIENISDKLLQLGHEHEVEGNIFNMEFTPNRGDCLSINGLLRDLGAFYTVNVNKSKYTKKIEKLQIDFENLSQDICPHISFLKLEIDKIPETYNGVLNDYFVDLDLNKNNFFTDISNYLSYETGQPTHCYDSNKIKGKLVFQELDIDKDFETLLDKKIKLTKKNPVFLLDNEIVNLGGVIGGKSSSCSTETKTVLVECAFFRPESIMGQSVKYDIQSEASHKFERSVDPESHDNVIRRFIEIVNEHTNIKTVAAVHHRYQENKVNKISLNVNKINQIIGINISNKQYIKYLQNLGFAINDGIISVPSHRSDIKTQNDLAEEVARLVGYNNIPTNELLITKKKMSNKYDIENKLRFCLLDQGFYEVINSPFVSSASDNSIMVDNPLDSNKKFLRTNITNSLIENLLFNERRQKDSIKLFEISDIYTTKNNEICKVRRLSIIASGRVGHNYENFTKKIDKKYLEKIFSQALPSENFNFQILGREALNTKIKNEIIYSEVEMSNFSAEVLNYDEMSRSPDSFIQYQPISELPFSIRDLSFSIKDHNKYKSFEKFILSFDHKLLKRAFIFDYYNNETKQEIKIGFRFIFQSQESTITDKEVDGVMNIIIKEALKHDSISIPGLF
jgi:phenylalanyl-tRNA synthetase beta chain